MKGLFYSLLLLIIFNNGIAQDIPRPEHPKPQFVRDQWKNLNGKWDFYIDYGQSGEERKLYENQKAFDKSITVPFAPESKLSGIEYKDFMPAVWYHRTFSVPANWNGDRVFLHFGAVDYKCKVWVNGKEVGIHYGGSVSFDFEITEALSEGENKLVVMAEDEIRKEVQPAGKQSATYYNDGCCKYTRVTGIWQTVWLEARPQSFIKKVKVLPDLDNSSFVLTPIIEDYNNGDTFRATLYDDKGKSVATVSTTTPGIPVVMNVKNPEIWGPDNPYLYDLKFELIENGSTIDEVQSYAGMRKVHIAGNKIYLNNEPVFMRLVLDQGFYPEGVWTAPSDEALKQDIEMSMAAGFNGARLHEKVFEERFHYWADKLGYLTWGEFPDWGMPRTYKNPEGWLNLLREWREVMMRDYNHPSIIAWTPMNETHSAKEDYEAYRRAAVEVYDLTKDLDPYRPVNTASGFILIKTDIWTVHNYDQNPEKFGETFARIEPGSDKSEIYMNAWGWYGDLEEYDVEYTGQPYVVDEYGGTFWIPEYADEAPRGNGRSEWGYGKSEQEVLDLIKALTDKLLENPKIAGFTYTQLTDVEQEVNGIYTFDRKKKFDTEKLKAIFSAPAAYEE